MYGSRRAAYKNPHRIPSSVCNQHIRKCILSTPPSHIFHAHPILNFGAMGITDDHQGSLLKQLELQRPMCGCGISKMRFRKANEFTTASCAYAALEKERIMKNDCCFLCLLSTISHAIDEQSALVIPGHSSSIGLLNTMNKNTANQQIGSMANRVSALRLPGAWLVDVIQRT